MTAPHRIRRFRCRVVAPPGGDAFALRGAVRRLLEDRLLQALEDAFDQAGVGDDVLGIDRLELVVRLAGAREIAERLPEMVTRELRERLAPLAAGRPRPGGGATARRRTAAAGADAALAEVLRTGALPPTHTGRDPNAVRAELRAAIARGLPARVAEWGRAGPRPAVLRRLLQLADQGDWAAIAAAFAAEPPAASPVVLADLAAAVSLIAEHAAAPGYVRLDAVAALVAAARGEARDANVAAIGAMGDLVGGGEQAATARPGRAAVRRLLGRAEERGAPDPGLAGAARVPHPPAAPRAAAPPARSDADPLPLLVPHAGLVLLHPFILRLFRAAGIVAEAGAVVPPEHLPRAAALLHFLATGHDDPAEFELGVVKLLLGLEPATPLVAGAGLLGDGDRTEAGTLLDAVIGHWAALRQTSRDGLRRSFLRRAGLLREAGDGWRLEILPEGFDVLLAHLPWGIGVVRLPWMPRPICVEWPMP